MDDLARLPHGVGRRRESSRTSPPRPAAFDDLIELGVTYRQLDYWLRKGMISLSTSAQGSGSRRVVTPIEAEAIKAVVAELAAIAKRTAFLRSGDFFEAKINELVHQQAVA